ncbi:hypothetical protein [Phytohabitans aurantiacus]|uniref:Bacteriophage protein n=1 Tax=Phytohabitans aurantiacus TaxID=3016789 RepID=A0ABQ5R1N1_9ACTN|nr:hypothetical protein [Phytohabitans aurantiacus]GLI00310.1 hypothetical protein Pa4123_55860 [Phytohabitans aurantiacus]
MNLGDVMDQVAARLGTIDGLRVSAYPPDRLAPPAAWIAYPSAYTFDATYGRGMDRITDLGVVVAVGKPNDRQTRDLVSQYADGSGSASVKHVLESGVYNAFDRLVVTEVTFDVLTRGGDDYLAALFTLDIAGKGSA